MSLDEDAVIALEARRAAAIGTGDVDALRDVLADDYLHVFASGKVVNKADYVDIIRKSPRRPDRGELSVRCYGTVAIITGDLTNNIGADTEARRVIPAFCTQVAHKRNGRWQFISYILTQKK